MALTQHHNCDNIIVLPADKGNVMVILSSNIYIEKMNELLRDLSYKMILHNPTPSVVRRTNELIHMSEIPNKMMKLLRPRAPTHSQIYSLSKICKEKGTAQVYREHYWFCDTPPSIWQEAEATRGEVWTPHPTKYADRTTWHHGPFSNSLPFYKVAYSRHIESSRTGVTKLLQNVHTTTDLQFRREYYEQVDGVTMGCSPLSLAIAIFYTENFEEEALKHADLKPSCFFIYMDNAFVIWPLEADSLHDFLWLLNGRHPKIQFTMQVEKYESTAFWTKTRQHSWSVCIGNLKTRTCT